MSSVLIVEDEQVTAMEVQAMVQELGYEVTDVVDTGQAAVDSVLKQEPGVILMDIHLPGELDGIEAIEQIHQDRDQDIPVVYITAHSDEETLQKAKKTRPGGYLVKPVTERDLKSTLEMVVTQQ